MSAIATPAARAEGVLDRAAGIELLGEVHGSGYRSGTSLVRRADGQVVQLGPLMYALLEAVDGRRTASELADELCERLGRPCDEQVIAGLAGKLAAQGLLAGHEHNAPPRRNPLLALRWKVLITNPRVTRALTLPFTWLFRPWIVWPVVACFLFVCWFVLFHEGFAAATSEAFRHPELLVLVFGLTLLSAAFHEVGHAAACRYGGGTPGGMGAGIYLVWPAFYTDVTDAYRLPRGDRLRVDLGGIYFNAVVAVVTTAVWFAWRVDALFLLVGLQLLMMVKNLSPVIRSDGYHILADLTGIPDLYAHIKPTLLRLLPWRRHEPSALRGRARALVTGWVLVVVPVLLALMAGAIILLPHLIATAWASGRALASLIPHQGAFGVLESLLRIFALALPALGSLLVAQRLVRMGFRGSRAWSAGRPLRRAAVVFVAAGVAAGLAYAWWPNGQYRPIVPHDRGTLGTMVESAARAPAPAPLTLTPGKHLALAMVPVGGATKQHPALYFIRGGAGDPPVALISPGGSLASAFPFQLPPGPGPGGTEARAVNTTNGGVLYDVEYAIVTVPNGAPVTNTNAAYAYASCVACTTVAVSFQVVLVVGQTHDTIAPIDAAVAFNDQCPACATTAIADQLVITLSAQPSQELLAKLEAALKQLGDLPALGAGATPAQIAAVVAQVQQQVDQILRQSGLETNGSGTSTTSTSPATTPASTTTSGTSTTSTTTPATTTAPAVTTQQTTTQQTTTTGTTTTSTTTTTPTTTGTTTTTGG